MKRGKGEEEEKKEGKKERGGGRERGRSGEVVRWSGGVNFGFCCGHAT